MNGLPYLHLCFSVCFFSVLTKQHHYRHHCLTFKYQLRNSKMSMMC